MTKLNEHKSQWYQSRFEAFEQGLNGDRSTPVHTLRRNALHVFSEIGFPTTREEEWRFINIAPLTKVEFQPVLQYESNGITKENIRQYAIDKAVRLVFMNGIFSPELSEVSTLPKGMIAGSLADILKKHPEKVQPHIAQFIKGDENGFTALNTAFLWDGAYLFVPQGVILQQPVQLLFLASERQQPFAAQPRNLILAEPNSRFNLIEQYVGLAGNTYLTNSVTEMVLGDHVHMEHDKFQYESPNAYHIETTSIRMHAGSNYISNAIAVGGSIVRNNITSVMEGEGIVCTLNGLSLLTGSQTIDNHTTIDHAKPHCNSYELYKSILDGESKGVFNGKIFVRKDAQKTDAKQTNKTLLLSDGATINAKPQLEIFADDVKCTHGATVGQLDDEQIFYLRSRGIDLASARAILTSAFASDVINRISIEPLRKMVESRIQQWLTNNSTSGNRP